MYVGQRLSIYSILRRLPSPKFIKSKQCCSFFYVNYNRKSSFDVLFHNIIFLLHLYHCVMKKKQTGKREKIVTNFNRFFYFFCSIMPICHHFIVVIRKKVFKWVCNHSMKEKNPRGKKAREDYYQSGCLTNNQKKGEKERTHSIGEIQ